MLPIDRENRKNFRRLEVNLEVNLDFSTYLEEL